MMNHGGPALDTVGQLVVVELLGGLGDVVMMLPVVHALARCHPDARLVMCLFPAAAPLVDPDPAVDEVVLIEPGPADAVGRRLSTALEGRRFDLGVTDTRYGGIPDVVTACCDRAITDLWRSPPPDQRITDRFLDLLVNDGVITPGQAEPRPCLVLDAAAARVGRDALERSIRRRLAGPRPAPVVALVPEAGMAVKRWGDARFIELARALLQRGALPVFVPGSGPAPEPGAPDPGTALELAAEVPGAAVLGPLDLGGLAGALAACSAAVAADTGPARVAAAVGTPTVALFGPTVSARFGLGPGNADIDSPVVCSERNPLDMTVQACWWSGHCIHEGRTTCTRDIPVTAVLDRLCQMVPSLGRAPSPR